MPGGIDPSTHFDYEFMGVKTAEDFYTGTRAALAGGTTTIIDHAIQKKGESLYEAYKRVRQAADNMVACDYSLHMDITWVNQSIIEEMYEAVRAGINSFKVHMGYKELMMSDGDIFQVFHHCKENGAVAMVHAENQVLIDCNTYRALKVGYKGIEAHYKLRSLEMETEAVLRACTIGNVAQVPLYICNVMSDEAAQVIQEKRERTNAMIFGEVIAAAYGTQGIPHKLNEILKACYVRCPPISRDPKTSLRLMQRLANDQMNITASDDCSFNIADKQRDDTDFQSIPYGTNGVQHRMAILWERGCNTGLMTPNEFVAKTSTNAAKIFNLYPRKGTIAVGSDADIVIWNPKLQYKISHFSHRQNCDYNIFHGMKVTGGPEYVLVRGRVSFSRGVMLMKPGDGKFLKRRSHSYYLYGKKGAQRGESIVSRASDEYKLKMEITSEHESSTTGEMDPIQKEYII